MVAGKSVYECEHCGTTHEVALIDEDAHTWSNPDVNGSVKTFTCINTGCDASYSVVSAKEETTSTVSVQDLANVDAIELKEATIALDEETMSSFGEEITITAEKITSAEVISKIDNLSTETQELIKDAPVFDFSMKDGQEEVHEFAGKVKITVPYELQEGEDPNEICIAYIGKDGEIEHIPAVYRNGEVSFETTHFSVYVLIKMPAEKACEKFGHNFATLSSTQSTCTVHGKKTCICTRCNEAKIEELPLVEHSYKYSKTVESTTTVHGYTEYVCEYCGLTNQVELPLLPATEDGYFSTLVKSAAGSNLKISHTSYDDGEIVTYDSLYYCFQCDNPWDADFYKDQLRKYEDARYTYNLTKIDDYSSVPYLKQIFDTVKNAPQSIVDILEYVYDVLERNFLTREETTDYYKLAFDKDKVEELLLSLNEDTVVETVDRIFGDGAYDNIYDLVSNFYKRTIEESIVAVEEKFGIDREEVYNFVAQIYFIAIEGETEYPEFEEAIDAKILGYTGEEVLERILSDELLKQVGTKRDLDKIIDKYKDYTVYELLSEFFGSEEEGFMSFDELHDVVMEYVEALDLEILSTKSGEFISLELSGSNLNDDTEIEVFKVLPIDEEDVEFDFEEYKEMCIKAQEAFDMSDPKFIDEVFNKIYEGLTFDYYESYAGMGSCLVSQKTKMFNEVLNLKDDSEVLVIFNDTNFSWIHENDNYHNMIDSEYSISKQIYGCRILVLDEDFSGLHSPNEDIFNGFTVTYDLENETYSVIDCNQHLYKVEIMSDEEFYEHFHSTSTEKMTHYKETCLLCGAQTFYSTYGEPDSVLGFYYEGGIISPLMNEEARKYSFTIDRFSGGRFELDRGIRIEVSKLVGRTAQDKTIDLFELCNYQDKTFTYGNVEISYDFEQSKEHSCCYDLTVNIKVGGELIISLTQPVHKTGSYTCRYEDKKINECCTNKWTYIVCDECGKTVHSYYNYDENHDYRESIYFDGQGYLDNIVREQCAKCGKERVYVHSINDHYISYDPQVGKYYCNQCQEYMDLPEHFEFTDLRNISLWGLEPEFKVHDYYYVLFKDFWYDSNQYCGRVALSDLLYSQFSLVVANVDDGEIKKIADNGVLNITSDDLTYLNFHYEIPGYWLTLETDALALDKEKVDDLLDVLEQNQDCQLYIVITEGYISGNTLVIPFSFAY